MRNVRHFLAHLPVVRSLLALRGALLLVDSRSGLLLAQPLPARRPVRVLPRTQ